MFPIMPNTKKDPFDNIFFWIKVVRLSLIILVPYWLFGFETGILIGIVLVALFLSKISLTLLEINEYLHEERKEKSINKPASKFAHKPDAEGKIIV